MKQIPLTKDKFAVVDDEWYTFLMQWKWYALQDDRTCYAVRYAPKGDGKNRAFLMHRIITNAPANSSVNSHTLIFRSELALAERNGKEVLR